MMLRMYLIVAALLMVFSTACAPKATPDDCKNACSKYSELNKAENPPPATPDPVATVVQEYAKKMQVIQEEQNKVLQPIDDELKGKLEKTKNEAEKTKLTEEANKQKLAKQQEFAPKFKALGDEREKAVKAAQEAKAQAEQAAKEAMDKEIASCADKCVVDKIKKTKAECQAKATTLDEYSACQ